jgi:glyoxylase-like metal-dependent hydrolase (beta-lactamase superfamily II)
MTKLISNPSRRDVLASAAGVSALGLTGSLSFLPSALAADVREKGYYSWKVGDIEVISIYDGKWEKPHDPSFVKGASVDETKAALREAGLDDGFVPIEFAFTAIKTGGNTILLDAGTGSQLAPTAGLGSKAMADAGLAPDKIDKVVVSHFHPDHIFGLMQKGSNEQVFPNAEIIVGETEYKFWTDPCLIEKLPEGRRGLAQRIQATFPNWKNVTQYSGGQELAPGMTAVNTFGHTAGHTAFQLSSGSEQAMLIGDVINLPALFLTNLDWQLSFDADKDLATKVRKDVVAQAVADDMTIAGYHFGFPNSGKIKKDGNGYVFEPTSA